MALLAQLNHGVDNPEWKIGVLAVVVLFGVGVYAFIRWLLEGPVSPDPWGQEVENELASEEATPLCHRCLAPQTSSADFCPECGATVGPYTNLLPYPYIFSVGHTLRLGTAGDFKRTPFTILGFMVFALTEYSVFAPVYWVMLLLGLSQRHSPPLPTAPPPNGG